MTTPEPTASALVKFTVTANGGLRCTSCAFAGIPDEVGVPRAFRGSLAWLARIADDHNREAHPPTPTPGAP